MLPKNWEKFKVRVFEFFTDLQMMRALLKTGKLPKLEWNACHLLNYNSNPQAK